MAKKVVAVVKLQIPAGKATPAPPVGTALGPRGVNLPGFCKEFNARTQKQIGSILPVVITIYQDKSYTFVTKSPPASDLLKKAAKIDKGSKTPGQGFVGKVTMAQIEEIAKIKMEDLNAATHEAAVRSLMGSAKSIGLEVVS